MYSRDGYRALLRAVREAGYAFVDAGTFDPESRERQLFLHHDIDVSPTFAATLAAIEAECGVRSLYLYLLNSPLYNPLSDLHRRHIAKIAELGHGVGVHIDFPHGGVTDPVGEVCRTIELAQRTFPFVKPIFAWHRPNSLTKPLISVEIPGLVNLYGAAFIKQALYMSDSNMRHKAEAFAAAARSGLYPKLNFSLHPVYWTAEREEPEHLFAFLLDHAVGEYAEEVRQFGAWKQLAARWDPTALSAMIRALVPRILREGGA